MQQFDNFPEFIDQAGILDNKYKILDTIGEGRYAKVKVAINTENNKKYAIKIMRESHDMNPQKIDNFINEVKVLASIQHENVVQLRHVSLSGVYKKPDGRTFKVLYYVMKIAEYGELYRLIEQTTNFPEKFARYFFHQIISGIESIHIRQIAHRDIKPENILMDNKFKLKICDFGFASRCTDAYNNKKAFDSNIPVGSPEYNPPEISNYSLHYNTHYFGDEMDIFASAMVLFQIVMRSAPFQTSHKHDPYYQRLCRKDKTAFWKIFQGLCIPTIEFKDLIEKMLNEEPERRLTLEDIKQHPWYLGELPSQDELEKEMKERAQILIEQTKQDLEERKEKKFQKIKRHKPYQEEQEDPQVTALLNQYKNIIQEINEDLQSLRERKKNLKKQQKEAILKQQNDIQLNEQQLQPQTFSQPLQKPEPTTPIPHTQEPLQSSNQKPTFSDQKEPQQQEQPIKSQRKLRSQELKKRSSKRQQNQAYLSSGACSSSSDENSYHQFQYQQPFDHDHDNNNKQEKITEIQKEQIQQFLSSGSLKFLDNNNQNIQNNICQQETNNNSNNEPFYSHSDSAQEDEQNCSSSSSSNSSKKRSSNRGRTYYPRYPEERTDGRDKDYQDPDGRYREQ